MKKDNNEKILRSSLSTLLKRFSSTDLITTLDKEYNSSFGKMSLSLVDDNKVLKKARINEKKLEQMMNTITEKGIASPVLVVEKEGRYEVIYPRIVYVASLKLKLESIPCSILNMEEEDILVFLASQIRDSKGGNIVELSLVLNRLQKKYKYKQKEIASIMNQSRSQITNIMRLIKMPDWILRDISNDKLSFGHARALSALNEEELNEIVPQIYESNLSVRKVENLIYEKTHKTPLENEQSKLSNKYHCNVDVSPRKVTFTFASDKERKEFIKKIGK